MWEKGKQLQVKPSKAVVEVQEGNFVSFTYNSQINRNRKWKVGYKDLGRVGNGELFNEYKFQFYNIKISRDLLHNKVNVLNIIELYTLKMVTKLNVKCILTLTYYMYHVVYYITQVYLNIVNQLIIHRHVCLCIVCYKIFSVKN